jgi:hypothetical protein
MIRAGERLRFDLPHAFVRDVLSADELDRATAEIGDAEEASPILRDPGKFSLMVPWRIPSR